jgi:hypothetical protein
VAPGLASNIGAGPLYPDEVPGNGTELPSSGEPLEESARAPPVPPPGQR